MFKMRIFVFTCPEDMGGPGAAALDFTMTAISALASACSGVPIALDGTTSRPAWGIRT